MRSALLLTLGVCCVMTWYRLIITPGSMGVNRLTQLLGWTLETLMTLAVLGGGSYLGLCVLDGSQTKMLPRGSISRAQVLWLTLTGVLAICPATLTADVLCSLSSGGQTAGQLGVSPAGIFLLTALKSGLLAPVLEELFFRGYLMHALERYGKGRALAVAAFCFALVHLGGRGDGLGFGALLVYVPLGMLLGALEMKTGSLLAPILVHACYNLTLIFVSSMGLDALFDGLTPLSCALRLGGCAAFVYGLRRAWTARGTRTQLQRMEHLTGKELAFTAAAAVLVIAAGVLG
ncbi:MAG: lysostaphin resistance A-like protein [Candidatus Ventricola sp.]